MREVKLLQGAELQVLHQQPGGDKSCSGQGIVQTPDQQAAEPLTTAELPSLLLQEGDAGAEVVLSLDGQLREERSHQMSVELRPVGVDQLPTLSHTHPIVLFVQVVDLQQHDIRLGVVHHDDRSGWVGTKTINDLLTDRQLSILL